MKNLMKDFIGEKVELNPLYDVQGEYTIIGVSKNSFCLKIEGEDRTPRRTIKKLLSEMTSNSNNDSLREKLLNLLENKSKLESKANAEIKVKVEPAITKDFEYVLVNVKLLDSYICDVKPEYVGIYDDMLTDYVKISLHRLNKDCSIIDSLKVNVRPSYSMRKAIWIDHRESKLRGKSLEADKAMHEIKNWLGDGTFVMIHYDSYFINKLNRSYNNLTSYINVFKYSLDVSKFIGESGIYLCKRIGNYIEDRYEYKELSEQIRNLFTKHNNEIEKEVFNTFKGKLKGGIDRTIVEPSTEEVHEYLDEYACINCGKTIAAIYLGISPKNVGYGFYKCDCGVSTFARYIKRWDGIKESYYISRDILTKKAEENIRKNKLMKALDLK